VALRRLFVAVSLTDKATARIAERVEGMDLPGRDVPPEKWHLTLRFIGGVEEPVLDRITRALDEADLGEPFRIGWAGLGAFPKPKQASVVWVGLSEGEDEMQALFESVEDALEAAGLEPEDRPFNPHLTISRLRPQGDVRRLVDAFEPVGGTMEVGSIDLYESHLGRGGAQYKVLESFAL
jgi:2'-5' RNA ligase